MYGSKSTVQVHHITHTTNRDDSSTRHTRTRGNEDSTTTTRPAQLVQSPADRQHARCTASGGAHSPSYASCAAVCARAEAVRAQCTVRRRCYLSSSGETKFAIPQWRAELFVLQPLGPMSCPPTLNIPVDELLVATFAARIPVTVPSSPVSIYPPPLADTQHTEAAPATTSTQPSPPIPPNPNTYTIAARNCQGAVLTHRLMHGDRVCAGPCCCSPSP